MAWDAEQVVAAMEEYAENARNALDQMKRANRKTRDYSKHLAIECVAGQFVGMSRNTTKDQFFAHLKKVENNQNDSFDATNDKTFQAEKHEFIRKIRQQFDS